MTFRGKLALAFTLGATLLLSSCGQAVQLANQLVSQNRTRPQVQAPGADDLLRIARAYAQGRHSSAATPVKPASADASADGSVQEENYKDQIAADFAREDYDALEKAAHADLSPTARFAGGTWRVWGYYEGLATPPAGGKATDDDWNTQINALKAWVAARPDSSAARIALAEAYDNFGAKARGAGYADTVSDEGWQLYNERLALSANTLVGAAKLKEKSPYWFTVMYDVAAAEGWDKSQFKELLDASISFEPSYYHSYRLYAQYIQPKWFGQEGDAQAFAEQISAQIGGEEGDFVYFELATTLACGCDKDDDQNAIQSLSWPKIKSGYAAMEHLYGRSSLKTNRFAYLAFLENDRTTAQAAFNATNYHWDQRAWPSYNTFLQAEAWANRQFGGQ